MSMNLPLVILDPAPPPGSTPTGGASQGRVTAQVSGKGEPQAEGSHETAGAEHGPDRFSDLLASLFASFTHRPPTSSAPTAESNGTTSEAQATAAVDLEVAIVGAGDLGSPTQRGLQSITSLRAALDASLSASLHAGDLVEGVVDAVTDGVADAQAMAQSMQEGVTAHLARGHASLEMAAAAAVSIEHGNAGLHLDVDLGIGGDAHGAPVDAHQPGSTGQTETASSLQSSLAANLNGGSAMSRQDGHDQPARASAEHLVSLMLGEPGPSTAPSGSDEHRRSDGGIDADFVATLSGKIEAGPRQPQSATPATSPSHPPSAAPMAHVQLVDAVAPLRHRGDGSYDLTLELHPAELGAVRVRAVFENGTIQLHLQADHPATRDLLQGSLAGLRTALDDAGLSTGQVSVGTHADWGGSAGGFTRQPGGTADHVAPSFPGSGTVDELDPTGPDPSSATAVDVLL
ncbi:MAG: flagellar hook-length control protein FliK [Actinobacteria bacterium]|nr:flagellar hook-length control protein FliK [Actinomycetota bacterium]